MDRHVSGVWVDGRLVADKYHRPLTRITDPHTGDTLAITEDGRIYAREPAPKHQATPAELDRMNKAVRDAMHANDPDDGPATVVLLVGLLFAYLAIALSFYAWCLP